MTRKAIARPVAARMNESGDWKLGMFTDAPPGEFTIVIDSREQAPYLFDSERYGTVNTVTCGLVTGDYSIQGMEGEIAVERKSLEDYIGSISQGRERFEAEMERGMALDYFALVIESSIERVRQHDYLSQMLPHSILQTAIGWSVRYKVQTIWAGTRPGGEYITFSILRKFYDYRRGNRL